MKRIICLILSVLMLFSVTACGKEKKNNGSKIDLEYYVKLGKIPESEYHIGAKAQEIKEKLKAAAEKSEHGHEVYDVIEGEENVLIDGGLYNYYYKKANENKGISYLISYDTAYGFNIGSIIIEVREAFKDIKFKEEPLNDKNSFFLPGATEGTVLTTVISDYTLSFIFIDNALCATALYITNEWK